MMVQSTIGVLDGLNEMGSKLDLVRFVFKSTTSYNHTYFDLIIIQSQYQFYLMEGQMSKSKKSFINQCRPKKNKEDVLESYESVVNGPSPSMMGSRHQKSRQSSNHHQQHNYSSQSPQLTQEYPIRIALSDGEEKNHFIPNIIRDQERETELTRRCINPPPNKTVHDIPEESPYPIFDSQRAPMRYLPDKKDWMDKGYGASSSNRHPTLTENRNQYSCFGRMSSSSTSSCSSYLSDDTRDSPRRPRKSMNYLSNPDYLPRLPDVGSKNDTMAIRDDQGRTSGGCFPVDDSTCHILSCSPGHSILGEVTSLSCNTASNSPLNIPQEDSVQSHPYGYDVESYVDPQSRPEDREQHHHLHNHHHHEPSLYSDLDNSLLYTSASRPSGQRTNSGKI